MNRNKSICITILCLSLAMVRSLPIDAQKVTFHDGFISLKQAFEKLESVSTYKIAYNDSQLDVSRKVLMDRKRLLNYILCIRFFSGMHSIVSASQFPYTNLSQGCH